MLSHYFKMNAGSHFDVLCAICKASTESANLSLLQPSSSSSSASQLGGKIWNGQPNLSSLRASAKWGCHLCSLMLSCLEPALHRDDVDLNEWSEDDIEVFIEFNSVPEKYLGRLMVTWNHPKETGNRSLGCLSISSAVRFVCIPSQYRNC